MGGSKSTFVSIEHAGALRQEKLELSAQVKKNRATVDHQQGLLNQAHEEVLVTCNFYLFVIAKGIFLCIKRFKTTSFLMKADCLGEWSRENLKTVVGGPVQSALQFIIFYSHKEKQQLTKKCVQQYCLLLETILSEQLGEKA